MMKRFLYRLRFLFSKNILYVVWTDDKQILLDSFIVSFKSTAAKHRMANDFRAFADDIEKL